LKGLKKYTISKCKTANNYAILSGKPDNKLYGFPDKIKIDINYLRELLYV